MDDDQPLAWCVVANVDVSSDVTSGSMSSTAGNGTQHFSAGTKVWVLPPQWGDGGEDLFVVGRHRGQPGGLVRMVLPRSRLTGFRVKPVYSPAVAAQLVKPWRDDQARANCWESQAEADQVAQLWSTAATNEG